MQRPDIRVDLRKPFLTRISTPSREPVAFQNFFSCCGRKWGRLEIHPADLENRKQPQCLLQDHVFSVSRCRRSRLAGPVGYLAQAQRVHPLTPVSPHLPQAVLKKLNLSTQKINDICNLAFVGGTTNRKISDREPSVYLPELLANAGARLFLKVRGYLLSRATGRSISTTVFGG